MNNTRLLDTLPRVCQLLDEVDIAYDEPGLQMVFHRLQEHRNAAKRVYFRLSQDYDVLPLLSYSALLAQQNRSNSATRKGQEIIDREKARVHLLREAQAWPASLKRYKDDIQAVKGVLSALQDEHRTYCS